MFRNPETGVSVEMQVGKNTQRSADAVTAIRVGNEISSELLNSKKFNESQAVLDAAIKISKAILSSLSEQR